MGRLLAGVGRATITPPVGAFLMGYGGRDHGSVSLHDDLCATALVLSDGEARLAIVCCDLIFLHPTLVARIRDLVCERTGIPAGHVMICCSHTHSGPVVFDAGQSTGGGLHHAYLDNLVYLVSGAVVEAEHGLAPALWGVGRTTAEIGVNRRQRLADGRVIIGENPGGATDPELLVLRIDALGEPGQPLALLVNYACHAVCLGSNNYAISADWPGVMRRTVEAETGALVGFVQGAGADINPLGGPQDTFASAQRLGTEIAQACLRLVPQVGLEAEIELRGVSRTLELDLERTGAERPAWEALVARALGLSPHEAAALLDRRFPWSAPVQRRDGGWTTPAEIQVFRLGDVALAAVGAEPFVEIGRQVKRRSPARVTLFAGYTNGSVGYLPTPAAYEDGGYEVDSSYAYYRLPAPLAPTCAAQVVDEILSAIDLVIVKNID